jgi:hypothetical protein
MYEVLSRRPLWATIQCFDAESSEMRKPAAIAGDVLALVEPLISARVSGQAGKAGR